MLLAFLTVASELAPYAGPDASLSVHSFFVATLDVVARNGTSS